MLSKMVVKTPNGIVMRLKPKYDARMTANAILDSVNKGAISVDRDAGSIHWSCRGYMYSAIRGVDGMFIFDGEPAKVVK
jgi:hypothetical protein